MKGQALAIVVSLAMLVSMAPGFGAASDANETPVNDEASEPIPGTLVIGFDETVPDTIDAWAAERDGQVDLRNDVVHFVQASFEDHVDLDQVREAAEDRDDVRYVERAYSVVLDDAHEELLFETPDPHIPDDPRYDDQWGFPAINAPEAWSLAQGDASVTVAVVDTGVDGNHPDLQDNLCGPHVSTVGSNPLSPWHYHGTHVAGTVAAVNDNGVGVAGVSEACIMAVQVLYPGGSSATIADGVTFAAENGADIISMSLTSSPNQAMKDAYEYAAQQDVLNVKSAGNSGCGASTGAYTSGTITWPGPEPTIMPVAALAPPEGEDTAYFSSCGPEMEIAAPGQSVLSTSTSGYSYASGTSMAAPHVSGVAALVQSVNPDLSALETRCVLTHSTDDVAAGDDGWDPYTGWGKVNALEAVQLAQELVGSSTEPVNTLPCGGPTNPTNWH